MKKLISRTLLLFFLVLLSYLMIVNLFLSEYSTFFTGAIEKHQRLEHLQSPKVIFVGGSNLAFGLDSDLVQRELGQPVVNMGLHAALGLRYMLEEIRPHTNPGDVVVIVPEYRQFYGFLNGQTELLRLLAIYPQGIRHISSSEQVVSLIRFAPEFLQTELKIKLREAQGGADIFYRGGVFNQYGDVISHLNEESRLKVNKQPEPLKLKPIDHVTTQVLNQFYADMQSQGVQVFFIFPCFAELAYKNDKDNINLLYRHLEKNLDIPILSSPEEYIFPEVYFFDTVSHLNATGRRIRTEKMINDLKEAMAPMISDVSVIPPKIQEN